MVQASAPPKADQKPAADATGPATDAKPSGHKGLSAHTAVKAVSTAAKVKALTTTNPHAYAASVGARLAKKHLRRLVPRRHKHPAPATPASSTEKDKTDATDAKTTPTPAAPEDAQDDTEGSPHTTNTTPSAP